MRAKVNLRRTIKWAFFYGGALGIILLALSIFNYTSGLFKNDLTLNFLNYLLRVFGLLFCMSNYSKVVLKRRMTFEQGFVFGFFTFLFAMIIVDLVVFLLFTLYPHLLENKIELMRQHFINLGVDKENIDRYIKSTLWVTKPIYILLSFSAWILFIGPFISLLASTFLMHKERIIRIRKIRKRIPPKVQIGPTISNIVLKDNEEREFK